MGSEELALEDSAHTREKNYKVVKMLEMNIDTLLQAAEYLERREREAEHGYASSLPSSDVNQIISTKSQRLKSTKKAQGSRIWRRETKRVYLQKNFCIANKGTSDAAWSFSQRRLVLTFIKGDPSQSPHLLHYHPFSLLIQKQMMLMFLAMVA